jgi:tripartite-type tricarboxylate transporter receptor subunit TctC
MLQVLLKGDVDFGVRTKPPDLAIFANERHPKLPEVPIAKELGVATSVPPGFNGVYAPKGLPTHIREVLEGACAKAVQSDTVRHTIANTGQTVRYLTGAQFHARTPQTTHSRESCFVASGSAVNDAP